MRYRDAENIVFGRVKKTEPDYNLTTSEFERRRLPKAPPDYKAHAERLAEALKRMIAYTDGFTQNDAAKPDPKRQAREALAAWEGAPK